MSSLTWKSLPPATISVSATPDPRFHFALQFQQHLPQLCPTLSNQNQIIGTQNPRAAYRHPQETISTNCICRTHEPSTDPQRYPTFTLNLLPTSSKASTTFKFPPLPTPTLQVPHVTPDIPLKAFPSQQTHNTAPSTKMPLPHPTTDSCIQRPPPASGKPTSPTPTHNQIQHATIRPTTLTACS